MRNKRSPIKRKGFKNLQKTFFALFAGMIFSFFAWTTESLRTIEFPNANEPPALYSNQTRDDLHLAYFKAIQEAKKSILLLIYGLTDDALIKQLNLKADEGIPVTIICDGTASFRIEEKLSLNIRLVKRMAKGLMHLKILVIDETLTWLGSANFTSSSLKMNGNLVMAMDCPNFAAAILTKANTLSAYDRSGTLPNQEFIFGIQRTELWFLPDNRNASIRVKEMIRSAKKTLQVGMFTFNRQDFAKELIDAMKRGIDVKVVIDHLQGNGQSSQVVEMLMNNGVDIHLSKGPEMLHHKFLIVDGNTLVNGSANWTKRAFTENDDCFMILHDLTAKQKMLLESLWSIIWQESKAPVKK